MKSNSNFKEEKNTTETVSSKLYMSDSVTTQTHANRSCNCVPNTLLIIVSEIFSTGFYLAVSLFQSHTDILFHSGF